MGQPLATQCSTTVKGALSADESVSVDSPYFWGEAFMLQHTASGQVACPSFLQPLAQGILSTGKSLLLLRAHQGQHRRLVLPIAVLHCAQQA